MVVAAALAAGGVSGWMNTSAWARSPELPQAEASVAEVTLATLPNEAQATHRRILAGGPFPYSKDGTVFFNRERLLPVQPRGYYREYTVRTPGLNHRGARRIVCGGQPPARTQACYYTADHYSSFRRIVH
jgi:ribonuclease T1